MKQSIYIRRILQNNESRLNKHFETTNVDSANILKDWKNIQQTFQDNKNRFRNITKQWKYIEQNFQNNGCWFNKHSKTVKIESTFQNNESSQKTFQNTESR